MVIATRALQTGIYDQEDELAASTRRSLDLMFARRVVVVEGSASSALRMLTFGRSICHFEALKIIKSGLLEDQSGPIWKQA